MTKREVLEYLKISHQTLYRLMKKHAFPLFKLNRRVLFKKCDIDKWLETKRVL